MSRKKWTFTALVLTGLGLVYLLQFGSLEQVSEPEIARPVEPNRGARALAPNEPSADASDLSKAHVTLEEVSKAAVGSGLSPVARHEALLNQLRNPSEQLSDREIWTLAQALEETPALAARFAEVARAPTTSDHGRGLALDLLGHSGSPAAQEALIQALSDPQFLEHAGDQALQLYQRIGFVSDPTEELLEYAERLSTSEVPTQRRAAYAAIGGLARRLVDRGRAARAEQLLSRTLRQATPSLREDQAARLLGLGNGAHAADQATLLAATRSDDPVIRHAATRGLRHYRDEQSLQRLAQLSGDAEGQIQRAALRGLLGAGQLSTQNLSLLTLQLTARKLRVRNHSLCVQLLAQQLPRGEARRGLQWILTESDRDPGLRARIRGHLSAP